MSVPFFDLKIQHAAIRKEIDSAISKVIDSAQFILGQTVADFEADCAKYHGAKYAIGVASGTDALHLALRAIGIKEGDEVITSPFTFVATAESITYTGAKPVFVDIDPVSFNLDPDKIKQNITNKTKAIIPVHLYGQPSNIDAIMKIAREYGLKVVEDSAQAIGAKVGDRHVSTIGDAGCLSFFPTKNLGAFGDGGMVITNDDKIYDSVKVLRAIGSRVTYHYEVIGYNSRLDALQAAILKVKLRYLEKWIEARRKNAALYDELLKGSDVITPKESKGIRHTYNQYTIRTKKRVQLLAHLKERGMGAMVYYPLSLHLQKIYEYLGHKIGSFPSAEVAQNEVISLPIFPELNESQITEVASAIKEFFSK